MSLLKEAGVRGWLGRRQKRWKDSVLSLMQGKTHVNYVTF